MTETRFSRGLAILCGNVTAAENCMRHARVLGLNAAGTRGRHRTWTADEVSALVLTFLLTRLAPRVQAARRRLLADMDWRRSTLDAIGAAIRAGSPIDITLDGDGRYSVTATISAGVVRDLAALVDDWGDAEAAE